MAQPVTERDFALFMPPPPPAANTRGKSAARIQGNTALKPAAKPQAAPPRPQVAPLPAEPEDTIDTKKEKAWAVWKKTFIAYGASAAVALCLFGAVQTELSYLNAVSERQELYQQLDQLRQEAISLETAIERKYSLDVIEQYALDVLHMAPIEGSRIRYRSNAGGDRVLR